MKIMSSTAYKIMEVELLLQIQKKYQKCPFCGSNYSKEKDVFSIHEDGIFERKCMCGYEISGHIDINGIIEKDYNESCAKNDFLMELKEGSLLHNDARGLLIQYPSVGNDTQFWLTAIKIKKNVPNYMELEDLFRNIINDLSKCNNSLTFFDTNFLTDIHYPMHPCIYRKTKIFVSSYILQRQGIRDVVLMCPVLFQEKNLLIKMSENNF